MIAECYEKAKAFLMAPVEALQKSRSDTTESMLRYYVLIVLFNAILTALIALIFGGHGTLNVMSQLMKQLGWVIPFIGAVGTILMVIVVVILTIIFLFLCAIWFHIWIYVAGGRKGYMDTVKALAYGSTPVMIIGWIPVIGSFIGSIWTFVLEVLRVSAKSIRSQQDAQLLPLSLQS
ncbi:MAG: YIP1 family protein [Methanoregula sp.]|nr:YIP1 family protein [Methanoregula sp.]